MKQTQEEKEVLDIVATANKVQIINNDQYLQATALLVEIKSFLKRIDEKFGPGVKAAWASYKIAKKTKDDLEAQAKQAEEIIKPLVARYKYEQEELRRQEERRLQAEAEAQKIADAKAAEERGDNEEAARIMEEPVAPMIVPVDTPKADGVSTYAKWCWRVTDESLIPREYLIPDQPKINLVVKGMKDKTRIPGIEAYPETVVAVRTS